MNDDYTIISRTVAQWNAIVTLLDNPRGLSTGSQYRGAGGLVQYIEDELVASDLTEDDVLELSLPWECLLTIMQLEAGA